MPKLPKSSYKVIMPPSTLCTEDTAWNLTPPKWNTMMRTKINKIIRDAELNMIAKRLCLSSLISFTNMLNAKTSGANININIIPPPSLGSQFVYWLDVNPTKNIVVMKNKTSKKAVLLEKS